MGLKKLEQLLRVAVSVGNLVSSFPVEQTLHSCCCARYLVSELHREEVKEKKKKKKALVRRKGSRSTWISFSL